MKKEESDIEFEIQTAMKMIETELRKAIFNFPKPFNSSHEGYAVLLEEVDELWHEIKNDKQEGSIQRQREEVVQVGAMAAKFLMQIK